MLKPNDIIIPEFSKAIAGGYKPNEVKAFIDQLVADYTEVCEAYVKREKELKEVALQLKETSEQYYELSRQKSVPVSADALSAELIDSATADAAKIIEEANTRAAELFNSNVERTKAICNDIIVRYIGAFEAEKAKFVALHTAYAEYVSRITEACKAQAEALSTHSVNVDIEAVKAIDFKAEFRDAVTKKSEDSAE